MIVIGVLCHTSEPRVAETVRALRADAPDARIVVCVNGPGGGESVAAHALDGVGDSIEVIYRDVGSKPGAWTRMRAERADVTVFADADIGVVPGSIAALVAALADDRYVVAAAGQEHMPTERLAARIAAVPHRLEWGGVLGTLYAGRTAALPPVMPDDVILDDAWVWGTVGGDRVVQVVAARAIVRRAETFRDLWRQRVRAEAGKRQLRRMGLPLAPAPAVRGYAAREWPLVAALGAIKVAARLRSYVGPVRWRPAVSTKR